MEVDTTLSPDEIAGATFEFSIRESYLDRLGVSPEVVELYHRTDGEWVAQETEHLSSGDTYHQFEGTMPSFSVFALGTGADVMSIDSNLSVTGAGAEDNTIPVGEAVTVSATVENRGQTSANETFELTANGEVAQPRMSPLPVEGTKRSNSASRPSRPASTRWVLVRRKCR